ncbi:MAG TPA: ATPase domain-containing protein [Rhodanobacteraceae bacterium]|nr:ATPase domain-containing protein [Rhodanobacteraceae bacterium]
MEQGTSNIPAAPHAKAATGVPGLDDVLAGGLTEGNVFLLEGSPGTGKTTIALRFLVAGAEAGDRGLYITLSETEAELRASAASHGWSIGGNIEIYELVPPESLLGEAQEQTLLYSADLELGETAKLIFEQVERIKPQRIVIDSLSEIRLLAQSSLRYRRQILALKHYFKGHGTTVLMLDDLTSEAQDKTVHSVAHGVIALQELAPEYGGERRRLRVSKYRGQAFRGGYHDFRIETGGVVVFPRLVSGEHQRAYPRKQNGSGIAELDKLLGGGVDQGTSVLLLGPSGAGKSILTLQFVVAAAARGERSAIFIFDEELGLLLDRARALGFDLEALRDAGLLHVEQVDAAELSPGEFTHRVRAQLAGGLSTVVIDSLNGYRTAMPDERSLTLHIHELLQFLNRQGVTTFLTVAQHGLVGDLDAPVEVTYLADTVILLRYFEAAGAIRRAVSVIKKRAGEHEETIREYRIGTGGVKVGPPLSQFHGVLAGVPRFVGETQPLLDERPAG